MGKAAKTFIVLCLAACIVAALLGCSLLAARHGVHRFYCPDEHCQVCFSIEAQKSTVEGWGLLALGMAAFAFALLGLYAPTESAGQNSPKDTLFTLGIRLNS